uniref:Uncharacterized protein n=1 Tax=Mus musculus TaxID=10090 RepID=Q8C339_MOUSE|nr:unnamed protein product [Mus musculus]
MERHWAGRSTTGRQTPVLHPPCLQPPGPAPRAHIGLNPIPSPDSLQSDLRARTGTPGRKTPAHPSPCPPPCLLASSLSSRRRLHRRVQPRQFPGPVPGATAGPRGPVGAALPGRRPARGHRGFRPSALQHP